MGKNLALAELRFVTALLTLKYRFRFAAGVGSGGEPSQDDGSSKPSKPRGKNGREWWKRVETEMRDQFTAAPGQLDLVFEAR